MRSRFWLPVVLSSTTLALASCGDDAPVTPPDDGTTGAATDDGTTTVPADGTSSGDDPDSTGMPPSSCGDGLLVEGEGCDDGNADDLDGCSSMCVIEEGWLCNGQPSDCFEICGDGLLVGEEACDDDNLLDDDGCTADCTLESGWTCEGVPSECATVCGDGLVVDEEGCDDTNLDPGDGCDATCEVEQGFICDEEPSVCTAVCGDGQILGDEQCDDDNVTPDDGCSDLCEVEPGWSCGEEPSVCMTGCGDGIVVGMETCDDANLEDGDGCSAACQTESGWVCMDEPSVCMTECGDGLIAGTETCDDGGMATGDGCDDMCQLEPGWVCMDEPSVCMTDCGDGVMVGGEQCDDGSIAQGDGCDAVCGLEFGWDCVGSPSVCTEVDVLDTVALGGFGGCVLTTLGELGCFGANTESEVGNGTDAVEYHLPTFTLDDVVAVAAGDEHHCAIRAGGSVWCWGDNLGRQMGPLSVGNTDEPLPIEVTGMPQIVAIDAGDDHNCAIDVMGQVWCWGDNDNRQLGLGGTTTTDSADPTVVPMPGGLAAIDLGLGQDHSCAVLEDNTVACWGDDDNGQLGDGASGTDSGDAAVVPGLVAVNDVEGGEDHTCALTDLGELWCWGDNIDGQLGVGNTTDSATPQLVTLPATVDDVSLGDQFACAVLTTDQVFCWGEGTDFQLGNLSVARETSPLEVMGLPADDLVEIEAGGRGACVITAGAERHCWGHSEEGQLGVIPHSELVPVPVTFSGPLAELVLDPPEYDGVMCGVLVDGTVECTGDGTLVSSSITAGAVGYFTPIAHHLTVLTPMPLLSDVQIMRMGDGFACAATSTDVQCWGDNLNRKLGQGGTSTTDSPTPVPVMGLGVVDQVELGAQHACVRIGGSVQCWGDNLQSQSGVAGTTTDQSLPVPIMNLADAVDLQVGEYHACALRSTGVVSCWGDDIAGQLGDDDGNTDDSAVPVDVVGLPPGVTQIDVGRDHACALAAGEVWCWGDATYGNLGQGNTTDSDSAVMVPGLSGIEQISVGWNFTCARDGAGDMWCWGYSLDGQLGDGGEWVTGVGDVRSPIPFPASGITDMVAGNSMNCIETVAGWSCLGFRSAGQLGNGTAVVQVVPTPTSFGL